MKPRVFILATCLEPDLLRATTMVFDTLRTGFPTAEVGCFVNCVPNVECERVLIKAMEAAKVDHVGAEPHDPWNHGEKPTTEHHIWLADLIERETEPFWVMDTDIAFWQKIEDWNFGMALMAGRFMPQFHCAFANAITQSRLHTSLLYLSPLRIKGAVAAYGKQFPDLYCTPRPTLRDLVYPRYFPIRVGSQKKNVFYDTAALLYHAIGGNVFNDEQNTCFDHLNFGTLSNHVAPSYPDQKFRESHFAIFENLELLRGAWKDQQKFYAERAV